MTINNLKPALELWDKGFNIIPVKSDPITPTPKNPAEDFLIFKTPLGKWLQYQINRASREEVKFWYTKQPHLNIGIITNGLLVVDADTKEGVQWCEDNLSVGIYSITAKGAHFYFKQPKNQRVNCEIKNTKCGIDIKADGGLVVAPPSVLLTISIKKRKHFQCLLISKERLREDNMTINNLHSALELWDNGFNIILINSTTIPPSPTSLTDRFDLYKKPTISWKHFQQQRVSREEVKSWYTKQPHLNIGIITNGLLVVDADTDEGVRWCEDNLSVDIYSITAKGGHYYFKQPKNLKNRNTVKKECGIDIRADGGYVVAPPSVHGSGLVYRWASSVTPKLAEILEMSMEEFEILQKHLSLNEKCTSPHRNQNQFLIQNQNSQVSKDFFSPVEVGGRNDSLARLTGSLLGRGFLVDQIHLETTKWNNKTLTHFQKMREIPQLNPSLEPMIEKMF